MGAGEVTHVVTGWEKQKLWIYDKKLSRSQHEGIRWVKDKSHRIPKAVRPRNSTIRNESDVAIIFHLPHPNGMFS